MRYFDEIAKKAQELSEKKGRPDGLDLDIWLEAERIVMDRQVELKENVDEKEPIQRSWLDL